MFSFKTPPAGYWIPISTHFGLNNYLLLTAFSPRIFSTISFYIVAITSLQPPNLQVQDFLLAFFPQSSCSTLRYEELALHFLSFAAQRTPILRRTVPQGSQRGLGPVFISRGDFSVNIFQGCIHLLATSMSFKRSSFANV